MGIAEGKGEDNAPPSPRKWSVILLAIVVVLLISVGFISALYVQDNQELGFLNKTISSQSSAISDANNRLAAIEATLAGKVQLLSESNTTLSVDNSEIAAANSTMSAANSTISEMSASIQNLQSGLDSLQSQNTELQTDKSVLLSVVNLEDIVTLNNGTEYSMIGSSPGYTPAQWLTYDTGYTGLVVFSEDFVPSGSNNGIPIQICSNVAQTFEAESVLPPTANYCGPQQPVNASGVTVYDGWFPVVPGIIQIIAGNNSTSDGTLIFAADLVY